MHGFHVGDVVQLKPLRVVQVTPSGDVAAILDVGVKTWAVILPPACFEPIPDTCPMCGGCVMVCSRCHQHEGKCECSAFHLEPCPLCFAEVLDQAR